MKTKTIFLAILPLLLTVGQIGWATETSQFSTKDTKFIKTALVGGQMEVSLGQLATVKGTDQSVKDFGNKMVADHQKAGDELKSLVTQKGAQIPEVPDQNQSWMAKHLQKLDGAEFDKMYIEHMVKDHNEDIAAFESEAKDGDDGDLKNWAAKTLPMLQEHLKLAKDAQAKVAPASIQ
jgi:putative membrane protein